MTRPMRRHVLAVLVLVSLWGRGVAASNDWAPGWLFVQQPGGASGFPLAGPEMIPSNWDSIIIGATGCHNWSPASSVRYACEVTEQAERVTETLFSRHSCVGPERQHIDAPHTHYKDAITQRDYTNHVSCVRGIRDTADMVLARSGRVFSLTTWEGVVGCHDANETNWHRRRFYRPNTCTFAPSLEPLSEFTEGRVAGHYVRMDSEGAAITVCADPYCREGCTPIALSRECRFAGFGAFYRVQEHNAEASELDVFGTAIRAMLLLAAVLGTGATALRYAGAYSDVMSGLGPNLPTPPQFDASTVHLAQHQPARPATNNEPQSVEQEEVQPAVASTPERAVDAEPSVSKGARHRKKRGPTDPGFKKEKH